MFTCLALKDLLDFEFLFCLKSVFDKFKNRFFFSVVAHSAKVFLAL
jgi:hypothetical protein